MKLIKQQIIDKFLEIYESLRLEMGNDGWKYIERKSKEFASELLALQGEDCNFENCDRLQEALRQRDNCMEAYEKLQGESTKDIPPDVIEKWADETYGTVFTNGTDLAKKLSAIKGAKAMQSGEIAEFVRRQNDGKC